MSTLDPLFTRLARSTFRSRFHLGMKERQYCWDKGADTIDKHAADFVAARLAPARPSGFYRPACHGNLLSGLSG